MRFTLRDDGYPFKKIMSGRKWVGRVAKRADGQYVANVKRAGTSDLVAVRSTEIGAFEQVAAEAMGYKSAEHLRSRNRQVNARKRQLKQQARHAMDEVLRGNFEPFDDLLRKMR